MVGTIGMDFSSFVDRYVVAFDDITKAWRIIDFHHPEAKKFSDPSEEVPDDSPALTLIPEMAFAKLINTAIKLGVLAPSIVGNTNEIYSGGNNEKDTTIEELGKKIIALEERNSKLEEHSGKNEIKKMVIDKIFKLGITEDINEIR